MNKKAKETEKEKALNFLKEIVTENSTIYTILRSVSKTGMSKVVSFYLFINNEPVLLDWYLSQLFNHPLTNEGIRLSGVGSDPAYKLIYQLSVLLFNEGYKIKHKWL